MIDFDKKFCMPRALRDTESIAAGYILMMQLTDTRINIFSDQFTTSPIFEIGLNLIARDPKALERAEHYLGGSLADFVKDKYNIVLYRDLIIPEALLDKSTSILTRPCPNFNHHVRKGTMT